MVCVERRNPLRHLSMYILQAKHVLINVFCVSSCMCLSTQAVVVYDWKQGRMCQSFQGHNREVTKVTSIGSVD